MLVLKRQCKADNWIYVTGERILSLVVIPFHDDVHYVPHPIDASHRLRTHSRWTLSESLWMPTSSHTKCCFHQHHGMTIASFMSLPDSSAVDFTSIFIGIALSPFWHLMASNWPCKSNDRTGDFVCWRVLCGKDKGRFKSSPSRSQRYASNYLAGPVRPFHWCRSI